MNGQLKKVLSIILSMTMTISLMPLSSVSAYAAESENTEETPAVISQLSGDIFEEGEETAPENEDGLFDAAEDPVAAQAEVTAAPTANELTYTGQAQELVTAGTAANGTLVYSSEEAGDYTDTIPKGTAAGEYTVWYKAMADEGYTDSDPVLVTVTIKKASGTVTAPTAKTLTYTGGEQELVNAGTTSAGTIKYRLETETEYSTDIPKATNAGTYNVVYKVFGDDNTADSEEQKVSVTIAPAKVSVTTAPKANTLTANGTAQALVSAGVAADGGKIVYSTSKDGEYSDALPKGTDVGNYTVYYKALPADGDANHVVSDISNIAVRINPDHLTIALSWYDTSYNKLTDTKYPASFTITDEEKGTLTDEEFAKKLADRFESECADALSSSKCWKAADYYGTASTIADRLMKQMVSNYSSYKNSYNSANADLSDAVSISLYMYDDKSVTVFSGDKSVVLKYSELQDYCNENGNISDITGVMNEITNVIGSITFPVSKAYLGRDRTYYGSRYCGWYTRENLSEYEFQYYLSQGLQLNNSDKYSFILNSGDYYVDSDYMKYFNVDVLPDYNGEICRSIDVQGFYNDNWIQTTYSNQGYALETTDLGDATVTSDAKFIYGGHYVLLKYTVVADQAINGGKLGIWTDVQIGDNDYAPVSAIKNDEGNVIGFELTDNHTSSGDSCENPNAKYMCYFGGDMLTNVPEIEDLGTTFQPADTYWYGYYGYAQKNVFNQLNSETMGDFSNRYDSDLTLTNTDSGCAFSWNVNQEAGTTKSYYVLLGIGDASVADPPEFSADQLPTVTSDGKVSAVVKNEVEDTENAGNITLSVITDTGEELTVCDKALEGDASPMTATFTLEQINAKPGTYTVKKVRATNKGGMPVTYTLPETVSTTVTLKDTTDTVDLTKTDVVPLLYQGWDWDDDTKKLSVFGLNETAESGDGLTVPAGTTINTEEEGGSVSAPDGTGIVSKGDLSFTGEETLDVAGEKGISADGLVTISSPLTVDVTEGPAIDATMLVIKEGADVTLKSDGTLVPEDGIGISIPEGYTVIGGKIEDGILYANEDAKELKILKAEQDITYVLNSGNWAKGFTAPATYTVGSALTLPTAENVSRDGYTFAGWYENKAFSGSAVIAISETDTGSKTYYAKWTAEKKAAAAKKTASVKTYLNTGVSAAVLANKVKITWGKVSSADGYEIYAAYCGKSFSSTPVKTIKKASTTSLVLKKIAGKKVSATKAYKFYVRAYKITKGKKTYIDKSITLHAAGKKYSRTNAAKITLSKKSYTLKKGKTANISAKVTRVDVKKKILSHISILRYWSANTKVATVSAAGKIKAIGKGTCKIYVFADNGVKKAVTVTVK